MASNHLKLFKDFITKQNKYFDSLKIQNILNSQDDIDYEEAKKEYLEAYAFLGVFLADIPWDYPIILE